MVRISPIDLDCENGDKTFIHVFYWIFKNITILVYGTHANELIFVGHVGTFGCEGMDLSSRRTFIGINGVSTARPARTHTQTLSLDLVGCEGHIRDSDGQWLTDYTRE
ncbi:hypothetical protein A2U01_0015841, partial [Trifolium medium]|nr:hypothetical protein [Trifolium medium]